MITNSINNETRLHGGWCSAFDCGESWGTLLLQCRDAITSRKPSDVSYLPADGNARPVSHMDTMRVVEPLAKFPNHDHTDQIWHKSRGHKSRPLGTEAAAGWEVNTVRGAFETLASQLRVVA